MKPTEAQMRVFRALRSTPLYVDEIAVRAGVSIPTAARHCRALGKAHLAIPRTMGRMTWRRSDAAKSILARSAS